jgi:hypothetical protein
MSGRDEDGELAQFLRYRACESQVFAHPLRTVEKFGTVQHGSERPAHSATRRFQEFRHRLAMRLRHGGFGHGVEAGRLSGVGH